MKKIKLLMPLLGLTGIASIAMPLTACKSKSDSTQYTVKFDTQGGSTIADVKVDKNGLVTKPTDPTKTGCVFGGWYKEAACTNAFDFNTAITADITLYAKWEFDGKVTDTELTAALNSLNNIKTRNYSVDTNTTYTTTDGSVTINCMYLAEGEALCTSSTDPSVEVDEAEISAYGARWNINTDTPDSKWRVDHILGSNESLIQQTYLFMAFNVYMTKGKKVSDLVFDATNKTYTYVDTISIEELNMPFTLKFKVNEQKQITTTDFKLNDGSVTMTGNFFDYGTTEVPTSIKQATPVNLFEATEPTVNGTATQLQTAEHNVLQDFSFFYVCDLNKFASTIGVSDLSATTHQENSFVENKTYLYKLGDTISTLTKDTDYEFDGGNQIDILEGANIDMTDTLVFEIGYTGVTEAKKMDYFTIGNGE